MVLRPALGLGRHRQNLVLHFLDQVYQHHGHLPIRGPAAAETVVRPAYGATITITRSTNWQRRVTLLRFPSPPSRPLSPCRCRSNGNASQSFHATAPRHSRLLPADPAECAAHGFHILLIQVREAPSDRRGRRVGGGRGGGRRGGTRAFASFAPVLVVSVRCFGPTAFGLVVPGFA